MLEEALRAEAQVLHDMLGTHDTDDFMSRLALRISEEAVRPERVQSSLTTPELASRQDGRLAMGQVPPPPPFAPSARPSARPRAHSRRRRPTPIVTSEPAARPSAVLAHVRNLCERVLCSEDIDTLSAFDTHYDQEGARTFACLLYTIEHVESAVYWWKFAAGAGDPLAAHLLAAYHAAAGTPPDARVWHAFARWLGYTSSYLPKPVRWSNHINKDFALQVTREPELRTFLTAEELPQELVRQ